MIVVTSDLGRVTTNLQADHLHSCKIVVTSDLGRVTTFTFIVSQRRSDCGDVRSRTSYNHHFSSAVKEEEL